MKMSDRRKDLRPREKLQTKGASALSDYELLMAMIGSGNKQVDVTKIARAVKRLLREKSSELTYDDLLDVKGIGRAKATNLMASYELWRRRFEVSERPIVDSPNVVVDQVKDIRAKQQEYFVCLTLDGANRLIAKRTISIGTLTSSLVHPREVFVDAIADRAASIIVIHNHPSGNLEASEADRAVTTRLKEVGELIGIQLIDHILVTKDNYRSII